MSPDAYGIDMEAAQQRVSAIMAEPVLVAARHLTGEFEAGAMEETLEEETPGAMLCSCGHMRANHEQGFAACLRDGCTCEVYGAPQAAASTPAGAKARAARVPRRCVHCHKVWSRHKDGRCLDAKGYVQEFTPRTDAPQDAPAEAVAQGGVLTLEQVTHIMDMHNERDAIRERLAKAQAFTNGIADQLATCNLDIIAYLHGLTRPTPQTEVR